MSVAHSNDRAIRREPGVALRNWSLVGCVLTVLGLALGCGGPPPAAKKLPAKSAVEGSTAVARPAVLNFMHKFSGAGTSQPSPAGARPRFTNIAPDCGVQFVRFDDIGPLHRILESNGGGVALFDYDADGALDLFFTNGCKLPLKLNDSEHSNEFFRNRGDGRFERATDFAGLMRHGFWCGCAAADFDNDGFDDLYVTGLKASRHWRNNGDGTFTDITEAAGTAGSGWGSRAAWADLNGDGSLDLFVVKYLDTSDDPPRLCRQPAAPDGYVGCSPTEFRASDDILFLSQGDGSFLNASRACQIVGVDGKGLGVAIFDADGNGAPDIFVTNDGTPNFLYMNPGPLKPGQAVDGLLAAPVFQEQAAELGVAVNRMGAATSSMGVTVGDYDADSWPDIVVTNFYLEGDTLFHNQVGQGFTDDTPSTGLGPASRLVLGFGIEFLDFDNDGWLDLFVANGHVDDMRWQKGNPPYRMPPQLFQNERNGRFADVSRVAGEYFAGEWLGRGVAVGDIDNDGDIDVVVSHQLDPACILRNDTQANAAQPARAAFIRLVGRGASNRSAIGARVETGHLDLQFSRFVIGGGSFQSSSDRRIHLGLGRHAILPEVTVTWPSGTRETWREVAPGDYLGIEAQGLQRLPAP